MMHAELLYQRDNIIWSLLLRCLLVKKNRDMSEWEKRREWFRGFGVLIIGYLDINMNSSYQIMKFLKMRVLLKSHIEFWKWEITLRFYKCWKTIQAYLILLPFAFALHRCVWFFFPPKLKARPISLPQQHKDYDLLYCDICFIVVYLTVQYLPAIPVF